MSLRRGTKPHVERIVLRRDGPRTHWGIRLVGGSDLGAPLLITRVQVGSPSERQLLRGDIIRKIGDYDARDLRHEDAQNLFTKAGNQISLVVQRHQQPEAVAAAAATNLNNTSPAPTPTPRLPTTPTPKPPVAGGVATPFALAAATTPARCASPVVFPPPLDGFPSFEPRPSPLAFSSTASPAFGSDPTADINTQPYRTTPLVLPGAKARHEQPATASYLRHHPNPMFRASPGHYDSADILMKQKVADTVIQRVIGEDPNAGAKVVHKQFNSPINLYSEQNIADTLQNQTGGVPNVNSGKLDPRYQGKVSFKKTVQYDPAKSETFKALQEAELGDEVREVTVPVQHRVFSPVKNAQAKRPPVRPQLPPQHAQPATQQTFVNSLGNYEENIHQSGSFKRLMWQVLGESQY